MPRSYPFQDPAIREKASKKARTSQRPKTYNSKSKRVQEAKQELIREELLREGFVQQLGAVLPRINGALIASALQPNSSGASDRRTVYSALKILARDKENEPQETIGQILARLTEAKANRVK